MTLSDEENEDNEITRSEFEREMKSRLVKMKANIQLHQVEKFPAQILKAKENDWMKKIETSYEEIQEIVSQFLENSFITEVDRNNANTLLGQVTTPATDYILAYQTKLLEIGSDQVQVRNSANSPSPGDTSNSLSASQQSDSSSGSGMTQAAKTAKVNVDIEAEKVSRKVKTLTAELRKIEDWDNADNYTVEVTMPKIEDWKMRINQLHESILTMKKNILSYDLDDDKLVSSEASVRSLEDELDICVQNIEWEDESRGLYSLTKGKSAEVKYPQFGGDKGEDFVKFENDLRKAFKKNQVATEDQVSKLKENLVGTVKNLIPNQMRNIDSALNILREMYGDAGRTVKARKDKLLAMGPYPKSGSKCPSHVKSQVEWLLSVENLLTDMFDLATKSVDCNNEVFNISMLRSIKNLFPTSIHNQFTQLRGTTKEQMEMIFGEVTEMRRDRQKLFQDVDNSASAEDNSRKSAGRPDVT